MKAGDQVTIDADTAEPRYGIVRDVAPEEGAVERVEVDFGTADVEWLDVERVTAGYV